MTAPVRLMPGAFAVLGPTGWTVFTEHGATPPEARPDGACHRTRLGSTRLAHALARARHALRCRP